MGCLIGIDYGEKRTGIAYTDPDKIIATGLKTILTKDLIKFLEVYFQTVEVETLIIGEPIQKDGKPSNVETKIKDFIKKIKINFPEIKIDRYDERYTSKIAKNLINDLQNPQKQWEVKSHDIQNLSANIYTNSMRRINNFLNVEN